MRKIEDLDKVISPRNLHFTWIMEEQLLTSDFLLKACFYGPDWNKYVATVISCWYWIF